jgi:glycosyltransferase involved in cell wall biosynthesis
VRWSELVFHNNISLRSAWPLLFISRPWVVTHAGFIEPGMAGMVKRFALQSATSIAISPAIADGLSIPSVLIPNPYDPTLFRDLPLTRDRELIFVGRLESDKGVALLLQALQKLTPLGLIPRLTVVGGGPQEEPLRRLAGDLGLASRVDFAGVKRGRSLVEEIGRHLIMVVPSLWDEPFGVVALEGIACGCAVVGSRGGGLPDAIGPCGLTFPNGDADALAGCLARLLSSPEELMALKRSAPAHLQKHTVENVARRYLEVFTKLLEAGRENGE